MPYRSDAQRRFFHSPGARRAGISASTTREYDSASRGARLPERAKSARESAPMRGLHQALRRPKGK